MQCRHQVAQRIPPVLRRDLEVRQRPGLLQPVADDDHGLRKVRGSPRLVEAAGRQHALAVPETVEGLRRLAGDRPEAEGSEVAKAELRRQAEIFVADVAAAEDDGTRAEARGVGNECVSTWRSRWSPDHKKKNKRKKNQS